jgi:hypothetical protein
VTQVAFADQHLRLQENPKDPANRRISIVVLSLSKGGEEKVDKPDNAAAKGTKAGATKSSRAQDSSRERTAARRRNKTPRDIREESGKEGLKHRKSATLAVYTLEVPFYL